MATVPSSLETYIEGNEFSWDLLVEAVEEKFPGYISDRDTTNYYTGYKITAIDGEECSPFEICALGLNDHLPFLVEYGKKICAKMGLPYLDFMSRTWKYQVRGEAGAMVAYER